MAYLELTMVAYDNIIKAAGLRGGQVAKVCADQGVWSAEAEAEAPVDAAAEEPAPSDWFETEDEDWSPETTG
jgi:hypothetical protein